MIVSGYPGLEIIAKLATVLECEPAELRFGLEAGPVLRVS
jgi:hypothetical protein